MDSKIAAGTINIRRVFVTIKVARRRIAVALAAGFTLLIAACAPQIARPPDRLEAPPEDFPGAYYRQIAAMGQPVLGIEAHRSLVVIEAHRGGSLARMGHDHVIAAHGVQGFVAPDHGRADLYIRLEELVVDEPELRAEAKLTTYPSADDIAGTRRNMLKAFEADRYPFAVIHIERLGEANLRVAVSLHGVTRTEELPAQVAVTGEEMTITGELPLRQSDFGIRPVSVLGGALQVLDEVQIRYSLRAGRVR